MQPIAEQEYVVLGTWDCHCLSEEIGFGSIILTRFVYSAGSEQAAT